MRKPTCRHTKYTHTSTRRDGDFSISCTKPVYTSSTESTPLSTLSGTKSGSSRLIGRRCTFSSARPSSGSLHPAP